MEQIDRRETLVRRAAIACLGGTAVAHLVALPHEVTEAPYLAALFCLFIYAAVTLALVLARGTPPVGSAVWAAVGGLAATALGGYAAARLLPLPGMEHHVGDWLSVPGVASLVFEAALVALSALALARRGRRSAPDSSPTLHRALTPRRAWIPVIAVLAGTTALMGVALASGGRTRPHAAGFTEGYGNEKVLAFRYDQQFFCTDDRGDDLDGPGHEGDGIPSQRDPDEFQHPAMGPPGAPCIVGQTNSGSLPRIDPTGRPTRDAEPVWAILPFFDSARDADATIEAVESPPTPPAVDVQCPEPGPPTTQHIGAFGTCTMHPSNLHAEPSVAELPFPNPAGDIPLPNHSHIIDGDSFNPIWWQTIAVRVTSERVWPNFNGGCPANPGGGEPCLTSLDALREAQARGQAGPDVRSNVWLFFDSQQVER